MKTITFNPLRQTIVLFMMMFVLSSAATADTLIKGRILNNDNQPIGYATALLLSPETGEILVGDMVDEQGRFYLERVQPGRYILSLRCMGYCTDSTRMIEIQEGCEVLDLKRLRLCDAVFVLSELDVMAAPKTTSEPIES
jgi:iron complex outermembrane recepter protein